VVVHAGAEEAQLILDARVASGELRQVREDVLLGLPIGQLQTPPEADFLGNLAVEDLLDGVDADRVEHRGEIRWGDGGVATQGGC
jgi:hypothetical protein